MLEKGYNSGCSIMQSLPPHTSYNIMSIQLSDYRNQSFEELVEQAYEKGVDNAGQFTHAELIFELVCAEAVAYGGPRVNILVVGLLEILSDGFGFLRSPISDFAAGADDVYVSPAQIRRFNLQTGDWIQGQARAPKDNERYFALLRIEEVNGRSPEVEKRRLAFDSQSVAIDPVNCIDAPLADVVLGDAVLLQFSVRQRIVSPIVSLLNSFNSAVLTVLNCSVEDVGVIKRSWSEGSAEGRIIVSNRGSDSGRHLQTLELGLERCKRLAEQFQDVHWIIIDGNQIAISTQFVSEQQGKYGSESLGVEAVCHTISQARNLESTGSLTIWMGVHVERSPYEDAVINRAGFEVAHCCQVQSDGTLSCID